MKAVKQFQQLPESYSSVSPKCAPTADAAGTFPGNTARRKQEQLHVPRSSVSVPTQNVPIFGEIYAIVFLPVFANIRQQDGGRPVDVQY